MKQYILLSFLFLSIAANAQVMYYDSKDDMGEEMRGSASRKRIIDNHITERKTWFCKLGAASDTVKSFLYQDIHFAANGKMAEYIEYRPSGRVKYHSVYAYNEKGIITEYKEFKPNGKLLIRNTVTYDDAGNVTDERNYWKSETEPGWHSISTYDDKQNIVTLKFLLYNDKKLYQRYEYSYYPDGSKKQTIEYNRKGKVTHTWNYDCNPAGNLEATAFKDSSKICIRYETDKDGNPIRVKEQNVKQGAIVRLVAKYDKNNNEIFSAAYNASGRMKTHRESVFNAQNRCTEYTIYKPYSEKMKNKFVIHYDTSGNETEQLGYKSTAQVDHVLKYNYIK